MSILSVSFLLFLTGLIVVYFALPKRFQWWILLAFSLGFYALGGLLNLPFLLLTALTVWGAARYIQRCADAQKLWLKEHKELSKEEKNAYKAGQKRRRRLVMLLCLLLVLGLPLLYRSEYGAGDPFFCKYLCPVGTLEAGVPLVLMNDLLRPVLGWLFRWKMLLLILCIMTSILIYRPFCKYICPLGAFYSLFQKMSLVKMHVDADACVNCGACSKACGMKVDPHLAPNSAECIRCGECMRACPVNALSFVRAAGKPEKAAVR